MYNLAHGFVLVSLKLKFPDEWSAVADYDGLKVVQQCSKNIVRIFTSRPYTEFILFFSFLSG